MFVIFAIIFGIFVEIVEIRKILRSKTLSLANLFLMMYGLSYGFMLAYFIKTSVVHPSDLPFLKNRMTELMAWFCCSILGYLFFQIGYKIKLKRDNKQTIKEPVSFKEIKALQATAVVCLIIGIVSMYLWSMAYNGISNLILIGDLVRAGRAGIANPLAFFMHPSFIILFTTILFIKLIQLKKILLFNYICLFIAFVGSVLFLLAGDGRLQTAMYFVLIILMSFKVFEERSIRRKTILNLGLIGIASILFIASMDSLTSYIRTGEFLDDDPSDNFIIREFSFIYQSGVFIMHQIFDGNNPYLIGNDISSALFGWVPTSMKPEGIMHIWEYNTLAIGKGYSTGETPTDFITSSLYDFSILGPVIFGLFWGSIFGTLDRKYRESKSLFYNCLYYYLAYAAIRLTDYTQLYDVTMAMFPIFVAYLIWHFTKKGLYGKKKNIMYNR